MPWVNTEICSGCEECVDECPVGAISMDDDFAFIDESTCIRCGVCHEVCPTDAVRHDAERIPEEVESNLAWVRRLLANDYYAHDPDKQAGLIKRVERFFTKEMEVAKRTVERLRTWGRG